MEKEQAPERKAPILQFPKVENQNNQQEEQEKKFDFATVFSLLLRRNLVFSTASDILSTITGEKNKDRQLAIADLIVLAEYALSNYAAMQVTINRAQDKYLNITEETVGRTLTPNDLEEPIKKTLALFFNILKESRITLSVADSNLMEDSELSKKMVEPAAKFFADTYAHAMRASKAIGTLIDTYEILNGMQVYINDEEIVTFAKEVGPSIPSMIIKNITAKEDEVEELTDEMISKAMMKLGILSFSCSSVNQILEDITSRNQNMNVMLNLIHTTATVFGLLASEQVIMDKEVSFEEATVQTIVEVSNAFTSMFEPKTEEGKQVQKDFVPKKLIKDFTNVSADIYNKMVEQANKALKEADIPDDKKKEIPTISEEQISRIITEGEKILLDHLNKQ